MGERAAVHAYLSQGAHSGLQGFAVEQGVSMSALLEAFGNHLAENPGKSVSATELVKAARLVDGERRQRARAS